MVWIALAAMTGVAVLFVLWPLAFRSGPAESDREAQFYRAQLDEIARDVERGVLPQAEAAAARAEAARRLLSLADRPENAPPAGATFRRRCAAVAAFVVIPATALAVYGRIGQPDLPDLPLAARKADINAPGGIEAAIAKIEAHLMKVPDDRRGWEVLAPIYMRMGRFEDAAGAYKQTLRLGLDNPQTHAGYGEALVALADGVVTSDARAEFDKAPDLPMSKFYLALAAEQEGKTAEAKAAYAALLPLAKGREPWMLGLRSRLDALNGVAAAAPPPAPAAAPSFSPDQRKMIEGMVSGLAERLATKGGSAEEWTRLIRAYSVLQQTDKAREAVASARKALGANPAIDALAEELRL
jgi:cytochrome c-type biogenesis protein CcmH